VCSSLRDQIWLLLTSVLASSGPDARAHDVCFLSADKARDLHHEAHQASQRYSDVRGMHHIFHELFILIYTYY
jgi:DMSO/TMAO reductase YedYZ molybdopterin-dependent catalytic subunit